MSALELDFACPGAADFRLAVTATLPPEGVTAIYGPSGSGKTTLLECIAGLRDIEPGGRITWGEEDWDALPTWQRRIGMVFQDGRLFPHLSVAGNLDFAARRAPPGPGFSRAQVLAWLGLEALLPQRPDTLSAGQKQRVAIARAILSQPRLLLLDEPLANLDARARRECLASLQRLQRESGLPMLYVSHDLEEVSRLADHVVTLDHGRVTGQGPMIDMSSALDSPLTQAEHAAAIVEGILSGHDAEHQLSTLELDGQPLHVHRLPAELGQSFRFRIPARDVSVCRSRPEDSSILNILEVTLDTLLPDDDGRVLLRLHTGQQRLLARITGKSAKLLALAPGDQLFAQIKSVALLSEKLDPCHDT